MIRLHPLPPLLSCLALLASAGGAGQAERSRAQAPAAGSAGTAGAATAANSGNPVVVELFTSQGCSSCPPADRLLSRLGTDPGLPGPVVALAFHVDYWNGTGWRDPFSSSRWSRRQEAYARAFRSDRIYTPQLVVNGRSECVGSQEGQVRRQIAAALAAAPAGQVSLALAPIAPLGSPAARRLRVSVTARLSRPAGSGQLDLWVALTQNGLSTPVKAGENAARTLRNDHVVRRLEKAFTLPAAAGSERSGSLVLDLDPSWKLADRADLADLGVAAFLQDPATLAIHGAAATSLGRR
jgi:hypothetical protein